MDFKATSMSINDMLKLPRKYVIPRFQREYSWENEELIAMWEDLVENFSFNNGELKANEYFIGSIVLVGDDDNSSEIKREVVDGQQRLTTFTIAFSVISQLFFRNDEEKLRNVTHLNILAEDNDGILYPKLLNESPKPFFQYRIQEKDIDFSQIPRTTEEKRILKAYEFFEKKLSTTNFMKELEEKFPGINVEYVDALKSFRDQILSCRVVHVTVKSIDDAYTIFEVLNSKGKDLTPVDIIKNLIFSVLTTDVPLDTASDKWGNLRKNMSNCEEDLLTFYRHFWLSKYSFSTSKKLVRDFKKHIDRDSQSYLEFINDLEINSQWYGKISKPKQEDWIREDIFVFYSLDALNTFNTTQVKSFLLAVFWAKQNDSIYRKDYLKILSFLEYFHFVFTAICSSRASSLERRYSVYARKIRESSSKDNTRVILDELISNLTQDLPSYNVFEEEFLNKKYTSAYTKDKKLIQYILNKLEFYYGGTDELRLREPTIEHIYSESENEDYIGMIGNLLPLGGALNSEIGNASFNEKHQNYRRSSYLTTKKFVEKYSETTDWNKNEIESRTKEIASLFYYKIW